MNYFGVDCCKTVTTMLPYRRRTRARFEAFVLVLVVIVKGVHAASVRRSLRGRESNRQKRMLATGNNLPSSPLEAYSQACKHAICNGHISQDKYANFIDQYYQTNLGSTCGYISFSSLPVNMQLKFVSGTCPDDPILQLKCLRNLVASGNDFFFNGNVNVLCANTYTLLTASEGVAQTSIGTGCPGGMQAVNRFPLVGTKHVVRSKTENGLKTFAPLTVTPIVSPVPHTAIPTPAPKKKRLTDKQTKSPTEPPHLSLLPTTPQPINVYQNTTSSISSAEVHTSGEDARTWAFSATAAVFVFVTFASTIVHRSKKRRRMEKLQSTDPALHGDASISSEHSNTLRCNDGESDAGLPRNKSFTMLQFKIDSWYCFPKKNNGMPSPTSVDCPSASHSKDIVWPRENSKRSKSHSKSTANREETLDTTMTGEQLIPLSPYLLEECSDLTKSAFNLKPCAETRCAFEPAPNESSVHDCLKLTETQKFFTNEDDSLTWRSAAVQPFSRMLGKEEGKGYFVDETSLQKAISASVRSAAACDGIPSFTRKINASQKRRSNLFSKFLGVQTKNAFEEISESSKESVVEWRIEYKAAPHDKRESPACNAVHSFSSGSKNKTRRALNACGEAHNRRPWRSRRGNPFSTVFGEQQSDRNLGTNTHDGTRLGHKGDNRSGQTAGSTATAHDSLTLHSIPMDEESLGSLAFISPELIKQFQDVDQRLSDGLKQFKEVDKRLSEEFDKLESNLGQDVGFNVTNDIQATETLYIDAASPCNSFDDPPSIQNPCKPDKYGDLMNHTYTSPEAVTLGEDQHYEDGEKSRLEPVSSFSSTGKSSDDMEPFLSSSLTGELLKNLVERFEVGVQPALSPQYKIQPDDDDCSSNEEEKFEFNHLKNHFASTWYQKPTTEEVVADTSPPEERVGLDFVVFRPSSLLAPSDGDDSCSSDGKGQLIVDREAFNFNDIRSQFTQPAKSKQVSLKTKEKVRR